MSLNESPLNAVALNVCNERYFQKNEAGEIIEDWNGLVSRVVNHVCKDEKQEFKDEVFELIYNTKFLPNSPCLVNAGRKGSGGLLACFVSRAPKDTWEDMCRNIKTFGDVARRGGGDGICLSNIRPEGDPVFGSTHAKACGPIEHMRMISEVMSGITQSGFRGMACLSSLHVWHPDVEKYIQCKQRERALKTFLKEDISRRFDQLHNKTNDQMNLILDKFISNFNISVFASDEFMKAAIDDKDWDLIFGGKVYKTVKAKQLLRQIAENAWKNGDPGLLFDDAINNGPYKYSKQKINASNPCGEQVLPDGSCEERASKYGPDGGGSCNLGSIAFNKFIENGKIQWAKFKRCIQVSFQFLDNVIDKNEFPSIGFKNWALDNRPVGLGIMGWADALMELEMTYGSDESIQLAEKVIKFMEDVAHETSVMLAKEKGTPWACNFKELEFRRNITLTSIAPTGTISMIAGCNGSIEPFFSAVIYRSDNTGQYVIPHPESSKKHFRCALDKENDGKKEVAWEQHVRMQAAWQKHCSSAISKTINLPNSATIDDVENAYILAWQSKCKGITVYRDGSKTTQVLNTKENNHKGKLNSNHAVPRPDDVPADIFKRSADGFVWHIIVGKVDDSPYELFAVNGHVDLPEKGIVKKHKSRHYSLSDESGKILIDNIVEQEHDLDPRISLETRRFSLELRHGIPLKYIVQQIDKSSAIINSFSKVIGRVFKQVYLSNDDLQSITEPCPWCAAKGKQTQMINESGCIKCPIMECGFSKCG